MYLKFGTYTFAANSVNVKTRAETVTNAAGIPQTQKQYALVTGSLLVTPGASDPQTDLTEQENALREALIANQYRDLVFYCDDDSASSIIMQTSGSLTGTIVTRGLNCEGERSTGEFASQRTFSFEVMREVLLPRQYTNLVSFTESLEFSGGGPQYIMCRSITGLPQRQKTWAATEYCVTQQGDAVGLTDYPKPPAPKFPTFLKEAPRIRKTSPDRAGLTGQRNFRISWTYVFESAVPLIAAPTYWTN